MSFFVKIKHKYWFYASLLVIFIIILNSRYWFLPLSPLLYPDRAISVAIIPISFFIGSLLHKFPIYPYSTRGQFLSYILIIILISIYPVEKQTLLRKTIENYRWIYKESAQKVSVTQDDIKVLNWISENTKQDEIFDNNYGDAGIWIPAIAYRKTKVNHSVPADFDELSKMSSLKPTYAFVGRKIVYPPMTLYSKVLGYNDRYELVYSSGNAKVYRVKNE